MAKEIALIRHGETDANAAGVWQGTSDSPLTAAGERQVELLSERLASEPHDLLVSSDLGRAVGTARALGDPEIDSRWRELHLGDWEGLSREEITARDSDLEASLGSGRDIAFGGGEKVSEMIDRLLEAFSGLVDRLDDGERALVVGHGGALLTLISVLLGVDTRGRVLRLSNTGLTRVHIDDPDPAVAVFNDTTHLPGDPVRAEEGSTHVVLVRHGETVANREGRWQGHTDGELTPRGIEQARALAARMPRLEALYASPLARALETARLLADGNGVVPREEHDLAELSFGAWDLMTTTEIAAVDPNGFAEIAAGNDVARGGTGETFATVAERVGGAIDDLAVRHRGKTIGVVSHGAATRAYVTRILGLEFAKRRRLALLHNTAMARVVYGARGPALAAWNLTPHLRP